MKKNTPYEELNVSSKHLPLRIAVFALALVVAAGAIGFGVSQLGKKEPGWYTVNAAPDDEALMYANGIRFEYYFEGSSDLIKASLRLLEEQYSEALLTAYKETDPVNLYPGVGNIAAINSGESVKCSPEFYSILKDACAKTLEGRGYNLFAGAYYAEWNSIIYSNDPLSYDPASDPDERVRLDRLRDAVNDPESFNLSFDDASMSVKLEVSAAYSALAEELEIENGPVDLNLLRDAYMLDAVRAKLEKEDWHRGYIATESGAGVYFSACDSGNIELFGEGGSDLGTLPVSAGESISVFRLFGYYKAGETLRSPYFTADGSFGAPFSVLISLSDGGDTAETVYNNVKMLQTGVPEKGENTVYYSLTGDEKLSEAK